jgi:predicted Zn-dependent peptidase
MRNEVKIGRLRNGLAFYSQARNVSNVARIFAKVGSFHNPKRKTGLVHLVEHVLARESSRYSKREVDAMLLKYCGGPGNYEIKTDFTTTSYGNPDAYRRFYMMRSFRMMANLLRERLITEEGINVEKAAIHQEYLLYGEDHLEFKVDGLFHEAMWGKKHPAGRRVDAELDELRKMSAKDIKRIINRYYVPANMGVVMLGPSHEAVRGHVREAFGDWEPTNSIPHIPEPEFRPLTRSKRLKAVKRGIRQYHVCVGFPTENFSSADAAALDILAEIWAFEGKRALRDGNQDFNKGVYRCFGMAPRSRMHGMIYLWFASSSRDYAYKSIDTVLGLANNLGNFFAKHDAWDSALISLLANYYEAFGSSPDSLADTVMDSVANGDEELISLHNYPSDLRRVNRHKLRAVANKYFTKEHCVAILQPRA